MDGPRVERWLELGHDYLCLAEAAVYRCAADCLPKSCRPESKWAGSKWSPRRGVIAIGRSSPPHRSCIVLPAPGGLCEGMFFAHKRGES